MDFRTRTLTSLAFFLALLPAGYLVIAIVVNGPGALPQPPPATVPGTDAPLRLQYTGVAPVDKLLVTLFRFFWPALDGASPGASFFLASFAGEIPGVWSLLMLEGIRPGNRGRVISYISIIGLIMQNITYACTIPMYLAQYFWSSPIPSPGDPSVLLPNAISTFSILPAIVCGFVLPSILAALPAPTLVSYDQKQIFMAMWQPFPLWTGIFLHIFRYLLPKLFPQTARRLTAQPRAALRAVYALALSTGVVARVATVSLSTTATVFPSLFAPEHVAELSLGHVFVPATALHTTAVPTLAAAVLLLLQWDQIMGSGMVLAWAVVMLASARPAAGAMGCWPALLAAISVGTVVLGPGTCAVALIWARDEIVLGRTDGKKAE